MVIQVYDRARQARHLERVVIAVDAEEVRQALEPYQAELVMTSREHPSGTDRAAEVVADLEVDVVLNIQGDEPGIDPAILDGLVELFSNPAINLATPVTTSLQPPDLLNPHVVKVVLDEERYAVAFYRQPSRWQQGGCYRHVGVYAYRKETLLEYIHLPPSENERRYQLEQLRALDNGIRIQALITDYPYYGVDTRNDLKQFIHGIS